MPRHRTQRRVVTMVAALFCLLTSLGGAMESLRETIVSASTGDLGVGAASSGTAASAREVTIHLPVTCGGLASCGLDLELIEPPNSEEFSEDRLASPMPDSDLESYVASRKSLGAFRSLPSSPDSLSVPSRPLRWLLSTVLLI